MQRGRTTTARWSVRLALAAATSLAIHAAPLIVFRALGRMGALELDVRVHTVEIGIETARPGASTLPPPAPSASAAPEPSSASSSAPSSAPSSEPSSQPSSAPSAPPPRPVRAAHRERPTEDRLPPLPEPSLPPLAEPTLNPPVHRPRINVAEHPATPSVRPVRPPRPARPSALPPIPDTVPTVASSESTMAPFVPRGSLVTLVLHTDNLRENPNARTVQRILAGIPDWEAMVGDTIDPVRDLDGLLLAASNPFGGENRAPDWFVIARGVNNDDRVIRAAIESLALAAEPPPAPRQQPRDNRREDAGSAPAAPSAAPSGAASRAGDSIGAGLGGALAAIAAQASSSPSAEPTASAQTEPSAPSAAVVSGPSAVPSATGSASPPRRDVFHTEGGIPSVTLDRYGTRRVFSLLGHGQAAIALPGQMDALRAALARRDAALIGGGDSLDDGRIVLLFEADGVRNLIAFNTWRGPFPFPARMAFALYQRQGADGTYDGSVELVGRWQYDDAAQAQRGAEMLEYSRGRWHVLLAERAGPRGGLAGMLGGLGASLLGIDVPTIDSAIDALTIRTDGPQVLVRASLSPSQVRAVLQAAAVGVGASGGGSGPTAAPTTSSPTAAIPPG